jgi:hypothetical protein
MGRRGVDRDRDVPGCACLALTLDKSYYVYQ